MTPVTSTDRKEDVVTHPVRVTQEPGVVREVSDAELLDLARQGLIHSYDHTDEAKAILPEGFTVDGRRFEPAERGEEVVTAPAAMTDPAANAGEADKKGK